ncbi:MAG TPA: hypothetical protein VFA96_03965, partial [Nocardioides sp.]|nr:hypothetical protein [Nocardioides sp.]
MRIRRLPTVLPAPPGKPERPGAGDTQRFAARVARDPTTWDSALATEMTMRFDEYAATWDEDRGSYRLA